MYYLPLIQTTIYLLMCIPHLNFAGKFHNNRLYKGRFVRDFATNYDVIVPQKVSSSGEFITYLLPHHYKRSYYMNKKPNTLCEDDKIHYKISLDGSDRHLELVPNYQIISPGMVIESQQDHLQQEPFSNIKIRKVQDSQCHFRGKIRGDEDSNIALSTCNGLMGHIRTKREYYLIEPAHEFDPFAGKQHPHIIYKNELEDLQDSQCESSDSTAMIFAKRALEEMNQQNIKLTEKYGNVNQSKPLYLETLVVMDKTMIDFHIDFDVENYVLTVLNMAADLFHDASFKSQFDLVIVRIIRLENENDELNLALSKNAEKTLKYFSKWQQKMNPGDDTHPNHHDVAVLITRIDICSDNSTCGLLGLAKVAGTCDPKNQAVIVEDSGLKLGYIIAHELGHSLGIPHDLPEISGCSPEFSDGTFPVMSPTVSMKTYQWSKCSPLFFILYLDTGFGKCLFDEPGDHNYPLMEILPGIMYGGEYQCRHILHKSDVTLCDMGLTCDSLNCYIDKLGCVETNLPPAPGTSCGEKKWCYEGACLAIGERPEAIDGGWSNWGEWSECSRTCGSGVAFTTRKCTNPRPSHGGKYCSGSYKRHRICSTEPCEIGQPTFRDMQCAEFNEWVFPEDGKFHVWSSYHLQNENPCKLFCINENRALASLKPKVTDGTSCYHGIRDICIGGVCTEIPCDLDLESNAVEDACGLCHGGGNECTLIDGRKDLVEASGMKKIFELPQGSRNVRVEETQPTKARIIVKNTSGNQTYIKGTKLGMFSVPGSKAWLGIIRAGQEALNIPGPISECLTIWILTRDNVTVKYSFAKKSKKRAGSYKWEYISWTTCSAQCGPGTQNSIPHCIEAKTGLVDDTYCLNASKLEIKVRPCETGPCQPRWMIGDWQNCTKGKMSRAVQCIFPIGELEGEAKIVTDSQCQGPKPHEIISCRRHSQRSIPIKEKNNRDNKKRRRRRSLQFELDFHTRRIRSLARNHYSNRQVRDNECNKTVQYSNVTKIENVVQDKEDLDDFKITIHLDTDFIGHIPKGLPQPPDNKTVWTLRGKHAVDVLQQIQKYKNKQKAN